VGGKRYKNGGEGNLSGERKVMAGAARLHDSRARASSGVDVFDSEPAFGIMQCAEYLDRKGNLRSDAFDPQLNDSACQAFIYNDGRLGSCCITGASALKFGCKPFEIIQPNGNPVMPDQPYIIRAGIFPQHRFLMDSGLNNEEVDVIDKLNKQVSSIV